MFLQTFIIKLFNRFTIADVAITYALYLGATTQYGLTMHNRYSSKTLEYMKRTIKRKSFQEAAKEQHDSLKLTQSPNFTLL